MSDVQNVRLALAEQYQLGRFVKDKLGGKTIEIIGSVFEADEPSIFGRPSPEYQQRELEWYESKSLNVNDIAEPIPAIWKKVATPDGEINSNYGWMLWSSENYDQLHHVIEELINNPDSRRAIAIYTRPAMWVEYNRQGMSDFVCTNTVQYLIRDGVLNVVVNMRSNDVVFGYGNDYHWQKYVADEVARLLELDASKTRIFWQTGSLHVYERHFYLIDWFIRTGASYVSKADYDAAQSAKQVVEVDGDQIKVLRKTFMDELARQITSVQPMSDDCMKMLRECSKSENELRSEGYEPIDPCGMRLLWVKRVK